jgi:hypothetical protein
MSPAPFAAIFDIFPTFSSIFYHFKQLLENGAIFVTQLSLRE